MSRRLFVALLILAVCVPFSGPATPVEAVTTQTTVVYDFIANAASASWRSSAVPLSFGGPGNDIRGFAMYVSPATLEDGTTQRKVLETHPQWVDAGWIQGAYHDVKIPAGATLTVKAGFLKGATGSNGVLYSVRFKENGTSTWYYFPNGTTTYSAGHLKTYDEKIWTLSWSLQDLAGKTGEFDLRVEANGNSGQDWACWQQADITVLSVPGAVEAHSFGTTVTVDWEYIYAESLFHSLSFEVQKRSGILPIWFDAGTVAYPETTLTLEDQSAGQNIYRVRAVETVTFIWTTTTASEWSAAISSWVLTAPVGAAVQHVEDSTDIRVKWTSIDPLANGYEILRTANSLIRPSAIHEGPRTDTSWVDTGLDPNKTYYYYVRAWKTGTESGDRDISSMLPMLTITTVPEVPAAQVAHSSGRTITISWVHSGNCSQFHVWSKPVSVVEPVMPDMLPATQRSKTIADAEYGRWYVLIRAWGEGGYSPGTSALDVWVLTAPSAPLATSGSSTSVNLTWGTPDANATTVHILRSASGGPFSDLSTVASSATSFTDSTCLPGTMYTYKLQAARDDDISEMSPGSAPVTTPAALTAPAAPTSLAAVAQSFTAVGLTWTDNANNETSYHVLRREGAALAFVQVSPDLPAGTTSWQDTTVVASSLYTYTVKAHNAAGDSGSSNEAQVTTPAAPVAAPSAPTSLMCIAGTPRSVEVNWSDNSSNEEGFRIERRTGPGAWLQIKTVGTDAIKWLDETVVPATTYSYRVRAYNTGGDSAWSDEFTVKTPPEVQIVVIKLTIDKKTYTVNGVQMTMDVAPVIMESRTLGPVRYIAEALGAEVAWDPVERKATITLNSRVIELWVGKNTARVDGTYMLIDPENPEVKPIILPPGRTMLPFRFIAEQLGAGVEWNAGKREVTITCPTP